MSNLAKSQADCTALFREIGFFVARIKYHRDAERKYDPSNARTQVRQVDGSGGNFFTLWTVSGVRIGALGAPLLNTAAGNTDEGGFLYVRRTDESPGAGQVTVDVYKATGGGAGNKVMTGSGADGATITLAAANSSGMTGTVKAGTVTSSDTSDKHILQVFPDPPLLYPVLFDGSQPEHGYMSAVALGAIGASRVLELSVIDVWKAALTKVLQTRWRNFWQSSQANPVSRLPQNDTGTISYVVTGLLEDGRKDMTDNTTAQLVVKNVVAAGSVTFDSVNQGKGAIATPSVEEWARDGRVDIICFDNTIGSEQFLVSQYRTLTRDTVSALQPLYIKKSFSDPRLGIRSMTMTRTFTLDSGSSVNFGTVTSYVLNNETAGNTAAGLIYLVVAAGTVDPAKFVIKGYKASTLLSTDLVFTSAEGAAGGTVTLTANGGSGLTGSVILGSAPVAGGAGTWNINPFQKANNTGGSTQNIPDKASFSVTVTSRGEFQRQLADMFDFALNSVASGGETVEENFAKVATFPAYTVDNA